LAFTERCERDDVHGGHEYHDLCDRAYTSFVGDPAWDLSFCFHFKF